MTKRDITTHELKILSYHFNAVVRGDKKCELRKNDRNFKIGDELDLAEIDDLGTRTGCYILLIVTHIDTYGMQDGYVALSFRKFGE